MPHANAEAKREYHREWARRRALDPQWRAKRAAVRRRHEKTCEQCQEPYKGMKKSRFCSPACSTAWMWHSGKANQFPPGHQPPKPFPKGYKPFNYKGGKITKEGYVLVHRPDHPMANTKGYVREHRLVMAEHLGRLLTKRDVVHHKNGVKTDNRLENLELLTPNTHHPLMSLRCPHCQKLYSEPALGAAAS